MFFPDFSHGISCKALNHKLSRMLNPSKTLFWDWPAWMFLKIKSKSPLATNTPTRVQPKLDVETPINRAFQYPTCSSSINSNLFCINIVATWNNQGLYSAYNTDHKAILSISPKSGNKKTWAQFFRRFFRQ